MLAEHAPFAKRLSTAVPPRGNRVAAAQTGALRLDDPHPRPWPLSLLPGSQLPGPGRPRRAPAHLLLHLAPRCVVAGAGCCWLLLAAYNWPFAGAADAADAATAECVAAAEECMCATTACMYEPPFFFPSFLECAIAAADAAAADDDNTRDLLLLPPAACWPLASPCPRVPGVPPSS